MRARWIAVIGAAAAVSITGGPAWAACRALTEAEALAQADVVVEAVSQPGVVRSDGTLDTPARFSVLKYLKGSGPQVVSVTDARGVDPMRILSGEFWVIYGRGSTEGIVTTSPCYGSYLGNGPKPFVVAPSVAASPSPTLEAEAPILASEVGWGVKTAAGVIGLALVMANGYVVARLVIGTT